MPIDKIANYWHIFLPFWQGDREELMAQKQNENQNTFLTLQLISYHVCI